MNERYLKFFFTRIKVKLLNLKNSFNFYKSFIHNKALQNFVIHLKSSSSPYLKIFSCLFFISFLVKVEANTHTKTRWELWGLKCEQRFIPRLERNENSFYIAFLRIFGLLISFRFCVNIYLWYHGYAHLS